MVINSLVFISIDSKINKYNKKFKYFYLVSRNRTKSNDFNRYALFKTDIEKVIGIDSKLFKRPK